MEAIDKLSYMGWEVDQGADPIKVRLLLLVKFDLSPQKLKYL